MWTCSSAASRNYPEMVTAEVEVKRRQCSLVAGMLFGVVRGERPAACRRRRHIACCTPCFQNRSAPEPVKKVCCLHAAGAQEIRGNFCANLCISLHLCACYAQTHTKTQICQGQVLSHGLIRHGNSCPESHDEFDCETAAVVKYDQTYYLSIKKNLLNDGQ